MPTINDLRQQAAIIKNATQVGENTATRVGTTFETIADLLEGASVGQGVPSVDLSQLNTLRTPADQTTTNPTIYNVTTLHNLSSTTIKVGTLFIFSDGGRAVVTQILFSNYQVDGGGNISSPNTSQITMYYRMFNIVQETWSAWTLYAGGGGGGTIDPYPVSGSDNAVASNGVFEGLQKAAPEVNINDIDNLDDFVDMQTGVASTYTIKAYHNLSSTWLRVGVLMVFANQTQNTLTQICISNCMVDGGGNLIPNYATNVMNVFYRFKQFSGNPPEGMTIGVWTTWAKFGDSGYQPDNEDIDLNANDQLQFANKAYDASVFSGLGRMYLRKNIVQLNLTDKYFDGFVNDVLVQDVGTSSTPDAILFDTTRKMFVARVGLLYYVDWSSNEDYNPITRDVNWNYNGNFYRWNGEELVQWDKTINQLTQAMVNTANTIYHIQYDYDLNGQTITLPAGCVLKFKGGSVKNGTIAGQNTIIQSLQETNFIGCLLTGNFLGRGQSKWFQDTMEDADIISSVFAFDEAEFDGESFALTTPVSVTKDFYVKGNGVTFDFDGTGYCFTFQNAKIENVNINTTDGGISASSKIEIIGCNINSSSINNNAIYSTADTTYVHRCKIVGGSICLYINASGNNRVAEISNNVFDTSTKYDNVQLVNLLGGKFYNNISKNSHRSGVVIGTNTENVDVFGNLCSNNNVDTSNQGGWGIVATYLSKKCRIYSNTLLDNYTGGITADLAGGSDESNYDAGHIIHSNYIKNGKDGIRLYKSYKSIVANNVIESTFFGILCSSSQRSIICGNIVFSDSDVDVTNTYGIQINSSNEVCVNGNSVTLINGKRNYCIRVDSSNSVTFENNKVRLVEGGNATIFNMNGTCTGILIANNDIYRESASTKYSSFAIITTSSSVIFHGNIIRGSRNGFQNIYNIKGNNASLIAYGNIIEDVVNRAFIEGTTYTGLKVKISDTFKGIPYLIPSESGTTANRPASTDIYNGFKYFDTDLGKPIWYNGTGWVDATGATVQ